MSDESVSISCLIKCAKSYPLLKRQDEFLLTSRFSFYSEVLHFIILADYTNDYLFEFLYFYKKRKEILDKLVCSNIRLVIKCAKSYTELGIPLEELINEGVSGLIHGICLFKPDTGNKLSTYITWWINQAIGRALENKSRLVRLPNNKLQHISKIKRVVRNWLAKHGEKPGPEEIQDALANLYKPVLLTIDEIEELGRLQFGYTSLDETTGDDENLSLVTYIQTEHKYQPENEAETLMDWSKLRTVIDKLEEDERDYIILRFGFLDHSDKTIKDMSQILRLTVKEVKEKEEKVLNKLKTLISKDEFNYY